ADRCSFVIAMKGSHVLALPGSVVLYEEGSEVEAYKMAFVRKQKLNSFDPFNTPFAFAREKEEKFGDNLFIVVHPGVSLKAGHNCVVVALSAANLEVGNYCTVLASNHCKVKTGIDCKVSSDSTCTVERAKLTPFPSINKRSA
ncbi:MAG: hypothetical protein KC652_28125, partial [Cyanobacteria bacterium HKST-UBA01]|nr:hypothetical protein [Cyanobacteria bacterium HKST-UBA01]